MTRAAVAVAGDANAARRAAAAALRSAARAKATAKNNAGLSGGEM